TDPARLIGSSAGHTTLSGESPHPPNGGAVGIWNLEFGMRNAEFGMRSDPDPPDLPDLMQQAAFERGRHRGGAVVDAELEHAVLDEPLRRRGADVQLRGDLMIAQSTRQQAQNFAFTGREVGRQWILIDAAGRLPRE